MRQAKYVSMSVDDLDPAYQSGPSGSWRNAGRHFGFGDEIGEVYSHFEITEST